MLMVSIDNTHGQLHTNVTSHVDYCHAGNAPHVVCERRNCFVANDLN